MLTNFEWQWYCPNIHDSSYLHSTHIFVQYFLWVMLLLYFIVVYIYMCMAVHQDGLNIVTRTNVATPGLISRTRTLRRIGRCFKMPPGPVIVFARTSHSANHPLHSIYILWVVNLLLQKEEADLMSHSISSHLCSCLHDGMLLNTCEPALPACDSQQAWLSTLYFETRSYMAMSYRQTIGRFIPVNLGGDLNRGLAVFHILDPERV